MTAIGFSTGALSLGDFQRAIELLAPTSADAIELSALRFSEMEALIAYWHTHAQALRSRYPHVSFHAPTNFDDDAAVVAQLRSVAASDISIVAHPDTIRDIAPWRSLGAALCLENMDSRKPTGRTADELRSFFEELPEARLCFDIGHAKQVDGTMTEGYRILRDFGSRLAQVHMSEVNSRGKHFPMSFVAQESFRPFTPTLAHVPIILESVVTEDQISSEIAAATELFKESTEAAA